MATTTYHFDFMLGQDRAFVVPAEALSSAGIADGFQRAMRERRGIPQGWIDLFSAAFALYWERAAALAERSPQFWLPPRVQNVCVVGPDEPARPFSQAFYRASWTMHESDFDPDASDVEFAAYLFMHQERMAQTQQILAAFVQNLPYWLERSDEEVARFQRAAAASARPDSPTFGALADSLAMVRTLHDAVLKPPVLTTNEQLMQVPPTSLIASQGQIASLQAMGAKIGKAAEATIAAFGKRFVSAEGGGFDLLRQWLDDTQPNVLVTAKPDEILWAPVGDADSGRFREIAGGISRPIAESMIADLKVIDDCTQRFLGSLRRREELPAAHDEMEQQGLSYIHVGRNLVAYSLTDPIGNRLAGPTPTYDRLMLAARTIHEWCHQAVDAGWVCVPDSKSDEFASLNSELAQLFEAIVSEAPAQIMSIARPDLGELSRASGAVGRALADYAQSRMPDFQANLLAQRYLRQSEREAYVRNNVYCLIGVYPPAQVFRQLARYAYEYQYLRFSSVENKDGYFRSTTWFEHQYVASGIVSAARVERLFALMAQICDAYAIDDTAFNFQAALQH